MSRTALIAFLADRMGLDAASLGDRTVDHALAESARALAVVGTDRLLQRVLADPAAAETLVEHFLVPESWFLRTPEQWQDLRRVAKRSLARPYRVLCLPCARGEEVYSVAITLLDAGLLASEFDVLGVDLSPAFIASARAGVFPLSAFRRADPGPVWFETVEGGRRAAPALRRSVRFATANAVAPNLLIDERPFDAIFCRNLLIYLHNRAREQVLGSLLRLSHANTVFFAGQAENLSLMHPRLRPLPGCQSPLNFVRAEVSPILADVALSAKPTAQVEAAFPPRQPTGNPKTTARASTPVAAPAITEVATHFDLDKVRALADAGVQGEAMGLLQEHLQAQPLDAEALFLRGVLDAAAGRANRADADFQQVLYLSPRHEGALRYRLALARQRNDLLLAERLRSRLAAIEPERPA